MMQIDTVVIGAGQAGLSISYYLKQAGRQHVVLEKERFGKAWRDERWDSFTLVTPNWSLKLPGMAYDGDDPDGFLNRQQVIKYLELFVRSFDPPIKEGVEVTAVEAAPDCEHLLVRSIAGDYQAANVVVATGTFQQPKIPSFSGQIAEEILQIHSSQYRNPPQLPPGAVLVVGSGQSGCQIAEELHDDGRKVYLSTGRAGRLPRRYRGDDAARWLMKMGFAEKTVDQLPSPADRFGPNPHASGKDGGRTLNLHRFSRDGITLLGHLRDGHQMSITVESDLHENLAAADEFASQFKRGVDKFIEIQGLQAPADGKPEPRDGFEAPIIPELDLAVANIRTIIWATGYRFDFTWVRFPLFDAYGYPIQQRGITSQPGLYFLGLHWLHTSGSSLLSGVAGDAAHIAKHINSRMGPPFQPASTGAARSGDQKTS